MLGLEEKPQNTGTFWQSKALHLVLIIIVGVLAYSNTFNAPFYFDDATYIQDNPAVLDFDYFSGKKHIEDITSVYKQNIILGFNTRMIAFLSFWMNYKIGGLNVTGYHTVNLLIHIVNACLVYLLARIIFMRGKMNDAKADYIALFAALLFVSHPLATQAVTYISQRFTSLSTMLYLSAVVSFALWRPSKDKSVYYILSLASAVLAMKTKEIAFTLPAVIMLYDFLFFDEKFTARLKYLWPLLCTFLIIPATLALQSKSHGAEAVFDATRSDSLLPRSEYFFTQLRIMATYLRLLVLPVNQTFDYDYPVYHSFFDASVILSFLLHASIIGIGVFCIKRYRSISFGICWFYIAMSVESSIIPIADVIFEHRVYLPSAGLFIAFAGLVANIYDSWRFRVVIVALSGLILIGLFSATIARNNLWRDEVAFWKDNVKKSPNKPRVHLQLAGVFMKHGRLEEAVVEYENVLKYDPDSVDSLINVGLMCYKLGWNDRAEEMLSRAIRIKADSVEAYINLGNLYFKKNQNDKGMEFYMKALAVDKNSVMTLYNIATTYTKLKKYDKAMEYFKRAIEVAPLYHPAHYNYGVLLAIIGDFKGALAEFKTSVTIMPDNLNAHKSLAFIYQNEGDFANAVAEYEEVVRLDPQDKSMRREMESIKSKTKDKP